MRTDGKPSDILGHCMTNSTVQPVDTCYQDRWDQALALMSVRACGNLGAMQ